MSYLVRVKESVEKAIRKLDRPSRRRVWAAIGELADDPRRAGCVKMAGERDLWRRRVGDYRIVYQIYNAELVVLIVRVGHRREVYRDL